MGISSGWRGFAPSAGLDGVTPRVLWHTFASVARSLSFSELTIEGLLELRLEV
jgi:hypothetical protein